MATLARDHRIDDDLTARRADVGNHLGNTRGVEIGEAGSEALRLLLVVFVDLCLFLFHERRDHNIVCAEEAHLLEDFLLGAVADGEHGNDGRDTEENA